MKTSYFRNAITALGLMALIFSLTSCDKKLHKEGSGVIQSVERNVGSFSALDADGKMTVRTHYSANPYIIVTTDDNIVSEVHTFVQDGKLHIEMNEDFLTYDITKLEIDVYTTTLTNIDLDGQVELYVHDTLESATLTVNHNGRGRAEVLFNGDHLSMRVNGSADMNATGTTQSSSYYINGEGKIVALSMSGVISDAHINGTGKIYVHCSDHLDATIDGTGDIYYSGDPSVTTEIHGTGTVQEY